MPDRALAAAIRPKVYPSSTTGAKKPAVATTARAGLTRTTAVAATLDTHHQAMPGPPGSNPAIACSSSPGGILQAQPPPRAY